MLRAMGAKVSRIHIQRDLCLSYERERGRDEYVFEATSQGPCAWTGSKPFASSWLFTTRESLLLADGFF